MDHSTQPAVLKTADEPKKAFKIDEHPVKRPIGRPPINGEAGQRFQVSLPPSIEKQLRALGSGSLSRGIVKAFTDKTASYSDTESTNARTAEAAVETASANDLEVTFNVVAYNASWNGYGDNASKEGFTSMEDALAYAKPLGAHLGASIWRHVRAKPVFIRPVQVWPVEPEAPAINGSSNNEDCVS